MTVYVDDMKAQFGRMIMCHMIADTQAELHVMADKIGVRRKWYQGNHYDIALSKKALAIAAGAKEITWRACGLMSLLQRNYPAAGLITEEDGLALIKWRRLDPELLGLSRDKTEPTVPV